mmetsp:Transcript_55057/g.128819  ORF Transcript_55057/g.128819 Transcript_55057/m.128819 type:complete len:829 (+) Transcript_55057:135-2621(+)
MAEVMLRRRCLEQAFFGVWLLCSIGVADAQGPTAVITSNSTQTKEYPIPLALSVVEPANFTIVFSEAVNTFTSSILAAESTTNIINFQRVDGMTFTFQVTSSVNNNVTLRVPAGSVRGSSAGGLSNVNDTGFYEFEFYANPPNYVVSIEGFDGASTNSLTPIITLTFDAPTRHDPDSDVWVELADILFIGNPEPFTITALEYLNDRQYRFAGDIQSNGSANVSCVDVGYPNATAQEKVFPCALCKRYTELCISESTHLPSINETEPHFQLEFPLEVIVGPIPEMSMPERRQTVTYDTYVPAVIMEAPEYARDPFWVNVTWSEPMSDLTVALPTTSANSPTLDSASLVNASVLVPRLSFQVLVIPLETGEITLDINGSQFTTDLAGNSNLLVEDAAGARQVVQFSLGGGPPLPGDVAFSFSRNRLPEEYPEAISTAVIPSLGMQWSGFTTAVRYDAWIEWGTSLSTNVVENIPGTAVAFSNFETLLGIDYIGYVRAYSFYGQSVTVTSVFTFPEVQLIANGTYPVIPLPNLLSNTQSPVEVSLIVPSNGFLSLYTLKVISFKTASTSLGDRNPCIDELTDMQCTSINFHLEVPDSEFVVFREPVRVQFIFGTAGWPSLAFRPQLYYWEDYFEEWRRTDTTCPAEKAYNRWNEEHRIYEVSICHFSQFSIFQVFDTATTSTTRASSDSDDSFDDPLFWVVLLSAIALGILACCFGYWAFMHPKVQDKEISINQLGIRSVADRLPSRFGGNANQRTKPSETLETDLLVPVGSPAAAIEDQQADQRVPMGATSSEDADAEAELVHPEPLPIEDQAEAPAAASGRPGSAQAWS